MLDLKDKAEKNSFFSDIQQLEKKGYSEVIDQINQEIRKDEEAECSEEKP